MIKQQQPFSLKARVKSFGYALEGIKKFFACEHNAWIHLAATIVVIVLGIVTNVSHLEAVALVIVVGLVWVAELFNTAIERVADFISTGINPRIKIIKDISAAAVLMAAIIAVVTGCFIFIPKF